jgi:uncharacterized membrane protein YdjX (TVP38/TMEM64 family)
VIAVAAAVAAFVVFDFGRFFTLPALKAELAALVDYRDAHPVALATAFFVAFVACATLALPIDLMLTVAGGALFGVIGGTILASLGASIGATIALLATRFLFRDAARRRFGERLAAIDRSMRSEGIFYLFALRMVPVFPFVLVNAAMGVTALPVRTFYWVTQLAMLPGTIVYANAGKQLASITTPSDILRPRLIVAFALLGIMPLVGKKLVDWTRSRRR